jgi:WD40 repeat protein
MDIDFDPQGRWLATGNGAGSVHLSRLASPREKPWHLYDQRGTVQVSFGPRGRWLATRDQDRILYLRELENPDTLYTLRDQRAPIPVRSHAFDPAGRWLAAGTEGGEVILWDLHDLAGERRVLRGHEGRVRSLAFHPEGGWPASGSEDGTVRLWEIARPWVEPRVLRGWWGTGVRRVAYGPEGRRLTQVFQGHPEKVLVWDLDTEDAAPVEPRGIGHLADAGTLVAFDPRWHWVLTKKAGGPPRLWDLTAPVPSSIALGGDKELFSHAADPPGRWLAIGGRDGTARVWSLADPQAGPILLGGHQREVWALAFDPSGNRLATASSDGTVRLWDLRLENLLHLACRAAGRELTREEWSLYLPGSEYRATCGPPGSFRRGRAMDDHGRAF